MEQKGVSPTIIGALIALLFAGLLVKPGSRARADVGLPPVNPGGASLGPQETGQTNVRMVSEEVGLTIEPFERAVPPDLLDNPGYWMRVLVDAQFIMHNQSQAPEAFEVWFPLAATTRYPELLMYLSTLHPENTIQDFQVWVDGLPIAVSQVSGPALNLPEGESPWATFPVAFPAGQDVVIRVSYTLYPGGRRPFGDVEYILQTGAGWKESIGEATITVYLPEPVTPESVSLSGNSLFGDPLEPQPAGYVVENNTISWHFSDLEPGPEDNIFLDVLEPQRYRRLLQARGQVEQVDQSNPAETAAALLNLARAAREAVLLIKEVTHNGGGEALAEEATSAYARALALAPDEPSVYSEYAHWLIAIGGWREIEYQGICPPAVCELVQRGLEMFPQDAGLQKIEADIQNSMRMHQGEATSATLGPVVTVTQPAEATMTALPTKNPIPTNTPIPATPAATPTIQTEMAPRVTARPSPAPAPAESVGLCPASLVLLVIVGISTGMILYRRRR